MQLRKDDRLIEQGLTSPPTQYRLSGRQFYRSKDPTNSIRVLKKTATKENPEQEAKLFARTADRTALQLICGHVTSPFRDHLIPHMPFPIGGPLKPCKPLSVTVSEVFNVEYNNMTLIRPPNKGQGHSFCHQSISHILYDLK